MPSVRFIVDPVLGPLDTPVENTYFLCIPIVWTESATEFHFEPFLDTITEPVEIFLESQNREVIPMDDHTKFPFRMSEDAR